MYNYTMKTSFVSPEMPKANKTGFTSIIAHFIFVENWILYDTIHDFSIWLRTGSNSAYINRFRNHSGK